MLDIFEAAYPLGRRSARVRSAAVARFLRTTYLDREDLEQDALVGLFLALSGFDPVRSSLPTYVERVIATRVASSVRQAKAKKRTAREAPSPASDDLLASIELRLDIERGLMKLKKKDRKVARLLSECSPSEVARVLRISRQAVYRSMHRIRMALCLDGFGEFV